MTEKQLDLYLRTLVEEFGDLHINNATKAIEKSKVEVSSWVFAKFGGGRFGEFIPPGFTRNINEKLDYAAFVNKLTDAVSGIVVHTLWDFSENDISGSFEVAKNVNDDVNKREPKLGSINPTYFLKGSHPYNKIPILGLFYW
jgi:L-rhamnose isomerase / sugar isomerase